MAMAQKKSERRIIANGLESSMHATNGELLNASILAVN